MDNAEIIDLEDRYEAGAYDRYQISLEKGRGSILYDASGKEYIDMGSGIGVNALGHADPGILQAISAQAGQALHVSNLYYGSPRAELCKLLAEISGMEKVFLCNSGAEANEGAIKAARKHSRDKYGAGRSAIVTMKNSFHGRTITTLAATGQDKFHANFDPFTPGFIHAGFNDPEDLRRTIEASDAAAKETGKANPAGSVCAIMIETIQGEGGVRLIWDSFAAEVERICRERDILLIIDEIQTGNGRTGRYWGFERFGLSPDIVTTAKGLGGGLPIGAVILGHRIASVFGKGDHGTTFGGNLLASAVAIHVVNRIRDPEFLRSVEERGARSIEKIRSWENPLIKEVRGAGLMLGIELNVDARPVVQECLKNGALFLTAGPKVLRALPPLIISEADLQKALGILETALAETAKNPPGDPKSVGGTR